jgi:protein-S-isoprenylcysteine O-methyltransferase Ste14
MFGMLLATLAAWTWWPLAIASVLFFVAGTEIRVRAEEGLLAERFGAEFQEYRLSTWAYIPFVR